MKGTILKTGMILGDDGKEYCPDVLFNDTILLAAYSFARVDIKDVVGKRVEFILSKKNIGYNFNLIKNED